MTMETFAKAFRHLARYSSQFAFSTWLFRITTTICLDFMRRKRLATLSLHAPVHFSDEGECTLDVCATDLNPQEACIRQQRLERVRHAVAQLPAKYIPLVRLRYLEELSYEEAAAELQWPPSYSGRRAVVAAEPQWPLGTVKANLNRARGLLAELLKHSKESI